MAPMEARNPFPQLRCHVSVYARLSPPKHNTNTRTLLLIAAPALTLTRALYLYGHRSGVDGDVGPAIEVRAAAGAALSGRRGWLTGCVGRHIVADPASMQMPAGEARVSRPTSGLCPVYNLWPGLKYA